MDMGTYAMGWFYGDLDSTLAFSHRANCSPTSHRFGLPHTDEDHFNRDRGDCMDYTTRTWNNLKPGDFNLNLLETLYGTPENPLREDPLVDGSSSPPTTAPRRPPPPPPPRPWNDKDKDKEKEDKDKDKEKDEDDRRRLWEVFPIPEDFEAEIAAALESCTTPQCTHELDEEYTLVINKLMV